MNKKPVEEPLAMALQSVHDLSCEKTQLKKELVSLKKENVSLKAQVRYWKDAEKHRAKKRRENHPNWEKKLAKSREGWAKNKDKYNAKRRESETARARDRTRGLTKHHLEHEKVCAECGSTKDLQFHHFNYEGHENVVTLCKDCHYRRHRL